MKKLLSLIIPLFLIPCTWGFVISSDVLSPHSLFSDTKNNFEDSVFIEEAETLWQMRTKNTFYLNNRDFESLQNSMEKLNAYKQKLTKSPDYIFYTEGTSDDLDSAISIAWQETPPFLHIAIKEAIRLFSENVMQHAYNSGQLYIKWNKSLGLISIAVFDQGPGFPTDKNGVPQITLGTNNNIKQREASPGRGIALGMVMNSVNDIQIITQGHIWKKSFPVPVKKDSIARLKGTMMIAILEAKNPETDINTRPAAQKLQKKSS